MPEITTSRELFLHELGDILYAEKQLVKALQKQRGEATDAELKEGFSRHVEETRAQVKNLEETFKAVGEKVKAEVCPGMDGLIEEHDEFVAEAGNPPAVVLDSFLTGSASRAEHYEIASYTGLVTLAKAMGESEAARLLDENLAQEKQMLKDVEAIAKRLAKEGAKTA